MHTTLADSLRAAAQTSPHRTVLVDKDVRLDCATLHAQAGALAAAMLARMPTGSVVSFMLPNWHESAVIYLAATLAGMVVNPILPSLRDATCASFSKTPAPQCYSPRTDSAATTTRRCSNG